MPVYDANAGLFFYAASLSGPGGKSIGVQSFAFDERTRNIYTLQLNGVSNDNMSTINRFSLDGEIQQNSAGYSTPVSSEVGHQGLGLEYLEGSAFRLWTTGHANSRQAVRYSYTDGGPLADIEVYTLFGSDFKSNTSCTPTISHGQSLLVAYGTRTGGTNTTVRIWRLADVVDGGPGDYSGSWLYEWDTQGLVDSDHPTQGIASDGQVVWLLAGNNNINLGKRLQEYTIEGTLISSDEDFQTGRRQALLDGAGVVYEPEGLAVLGNGPGLTLCVGVISGDLGTRFARIYGIGMKNSLYASTIFLDGNRRGAITSSTSAGRQFLSIRGDIDGAHGAGINLYGAGDSGYPNKVGIVAGGVTSTVGTFARVGNSLNLESTSGELRLDALAGTAVRLRVDGVTGLAVSTDTTITYKNFRPVNANAFTCGSSSHPWSGGATQVAFTVTSDIRAKQDVEAPTDQILDAVEETGIVTYRLINRVEDKGHNARHHAGVIAQQLEECFERNGVDPFKLGVLGKDVWEAKEAVYDDDGTLLEPALEAGDIYNVRLTEFLALKCAALSRNLKRLEERLAALETK